MSQPANLPPRARLAMPITTDQAVAIVESRRLVVFRAADGWHAKSTHPRTGELTRQHPDAMPTWLEAVEAAETRILEGEQRDQLRAATRVVAALRRGRYHLDPRVEQFTNGNGEPAQRVVFDAYTRNNQPIPQVQGREDYVQAVIDLEALLP